MGCTVFRTTITSRGQAYNDSMKGWHHTVSAGCVEPQFQRYLHKFILDRLFNVSPTQQYSKGAACCPADCKMNQSLLLLFASCCHQFLCHCLSVSSQVVNNHCCKAKFSSACYKGSWPQRLQWNLASAPGCFVPINADQSHSWRIPTMKVSWCSIAYCLNTLSFHSK